MRFLRPRRLVMLVALLLAVPSASQAQSAAASKLAEAASRHETALVRTLLSQKPDVNAPDLQGTPALHWAVQLDDIDLTRLLLTAGADAKLANRYGVTPLTLAVTNGNPAIVGLLLEAGADANALDPAAETMLMIA